MMSVERKRIADWSSGDYISAYVFLTLPQIVGEGRGRRHTATASDASGAVDVVDFKGVLRNVRTKGFYAIQGPVGKYRESLQLLPSSCREVTEDDRERGFTEESCILSAPVPIDELVHRLTTHLDSLTSPLAKSYWSAAWEQYGNKLKCWPAAQSVHHAYRHGLIYHTVTMLRVGHMLTSHVYPLDWDVVALGILFHDLGKIEEIGERPGDEYTLRGRAEGHVHISAKMWDDTGVTLGVSLSSPLHSHVRHLILSHHGSKEFGSPVTPLTREAWLLHYLDMIDSRLEIVRAGTSKASPGDVIDCWPVGKAMRAWPEEGMEDPNE